MTSLVWSGSACWLRNVSEEKLRTNERVIPRESLIVQFAWSNVRYAYYTRRDTITPELNQFYAPHRHQLGLH